MNIALTSLYLPTGSKIGVGYQAHYMANAWVRCGHAVTMFSPCERAEDAMYKHRRVEVGNSFRTFRFAWRLRQQDWSEFDIIHAHGDDYWLWGTGNGWPRPAHVRTMHGSCLAESVHVPRIREKVRMAMLGASEILATCVADRTVCVSRNTRRYYPWVREVIPNGVDLAGFKPAQAKELAPTILFVGTYQNRKRGKLLVEEFLRVILPALPEVQLWMVCEDAPPSPGVKVFGRVDQQTLSQLYRRAWVFCLPSSYEGFGVPYIEAMASGTPVVATPNVGAREVLADGKYGLLAPPDRLGSALLHLLQNVEERRRLADLGLQRAQHFGWDRILEQYEKIYSQLLHRSGSPARVMQ